MAQLRLGEFGGDEFVPPASFCGADTICGADSGVVHEAKFGSLEIRKVSDCL